MAGWKLDQPIEDVQYFLLNLGFFLPYTSIHPHKNQMMIWKLQFFSIQVHVTIFNFHCQAPRSSTTKALVEILSTNQSRLIFPQRLLDRRSRKNVGRRPRNCLAIFCRLYYEPKLWSFKHQRKNYFKKNPSAHFWSHMVFCFWSLFHHLPLKNSLEQKNASPMRLAKIQQPHPSQQPRIVAHAQQGGEFGRAEKSHCYSHLKPKVSPSYGFLGLCVCVFIRMNLKNVFFSHQFPAALGHFEE